MFPPCDPPRWAKSFFPPVFLLFLNQNVKMQEKTNFINFKLNSNSNTVFSPICFKNYFLQKLNTIKKFILVGSDFWPTLCITLGASQRSSSMVLSSWICTYDPEKRNDTSKSWQTSPDISIIQKKKKKLSFWLVTLRTNTAATSIACKCADVIYVRLIFNWRDRVFKQGVARWFRSTWSSRSPLVWPVPFPGRCTSLFRRISMTWNRGTISASATTSC